MVTRTVYVPANHFGRQLLASIWSRISCSFGIIHKVNQEILCAPITLDEKDTMKLNRILQKYGLM